MQKVLLIWLLTWFCTATAVKAQSHKAYKSWQEVARGILNGERDAADIVFGFKRQLESSAEWTAAERDSYVEAVRILNGYCSSQGLYKEQETLLDDAMRTFNHRDSTPNSPHIRKLLVFKMTARADIGDYKAALNTGYKALSMYEAANDYGTDYLLLCANISLAYLQLGDILNAKLYMDESEGAAQRATHLTKDANYYVVLNQKGLIYSQLGQYDKSIACLKEVVDSASYDLLGDYYALATNNLAAVYLQSNQLDEGIRILQDVPEIIPNLRYSKYQNLAFAYHLAGNGQMASESLRKFNQEALSGELRIIQNFSEIERDAYLTMRNKEILLINNLIANNSILYTKEAFDINLFTRQISLFLNRQMREKARFTTWGMLRQQLLNTELTSMQRDSIQRNIVELEKTILRSDTTLAANAVFNDWTFDRIVGSLKAHEAVVLFCYAPELKSFTDVQPRYGAFVLRKGDKYPKLIPLAPVDSAEAIFYNSEPTAEFISQLYAADKAQSLYHYLWEPLEQQLDGIRTVYYSTVGPLSSLNFDALVDDYGVRLRDKIHLVMLSSPNEKATHHNLSTAKYFMAFGAPAFNLTPKEMLDTAGDSTQLHREEDGWSTFRGLNYRGGWQEIPGTQKEIEAILPLMKQKHIPCTALLGKEANEETFKSISGHSPTILHIATHGFAISTQSQYDKSRYAQSVTGLTPTNSYMLWSGLVLSGGNATWKGAHVPVRVEDGILTADEIARLDLSGTELVVLSACETARGHIDPVEGVWGLQRAFKQAGVKTILMTLWKVDDEITALFMEQFYKHLLQGKTVRQSVKLAQNYLICYGASDPFYWAPFVVLD